ncbi:MAG: hypothetical protein HYZ51_01325 [Candidatus Doudnabacteria bacterium]|nr:hypothetical protein [Candidatus Doudnabacteria bacterium]
MKNKKTIQAIFLSLILTNLFLASNLNVSYAQTAVSKPRQYDSGVDKQIAQFLCTPSDASQDKTAASGDLYNCINKVYRFALVVASVFGVFMLVIAGYIYMSAGGNEEAVTKAKDILTTTIASLVILASGYILLKFLNPDLIKFQPIQPPSVIGKDRWAAVAPDQLDALFAKSGITVAPGAKVSGLVQAVANEISALKQNCNCNVTITSSTGGAHAPGECSHASGNKVDIRPNAALDAHILKFNRPSPNIRNDGAPLYISPNGAIYADERTKPAKASNWTGAHWDVAVCGGGSSASGSQTPQTVAAQTSNLGFLKPWAGTDPYPDGDYNNTKPELRPVVQAFSAAWQNQGGNALQVRQINRPANYQDHLRSVWEVYQIENKKAYTIGYGCNSYQHLDPVVIEVALKSLTVQQHTQLTSEYQKHAVTGSTPPACKSDHSDGIAVDISPPAINGANYTKWMLTGESVGLCHYIGGDAPHFALKNYLPAGTNCLTP